MIVRRTKLFAVSVACILATAATIFVLSPSSIASGAPLPGDGVTLKITGASIPSDLKPVVTFSLTDSGGNPVRLSDIDQGGLRFTIAAIQDDPDTNSTKYVNYVLSTVSGKSYQSGDSTKQPALASASQAGVDTGGVFADLGNGRFTYTFGVAAPKDFNPQSSHAIGGYATRANRASVSNDVFYFVPAGGTPQVQRQVVQLENCNACHDKLAAHGGTRTDTRLCVLCHTSQTTDPESGNTVDFKVMIHKLHSGADLPSVQAGNPYFIVGFNQSVADYSNVRWPQDTRNCQSCHKNAPQGDDHKTKPSAQACGACHDTVNFQTGENHAGGPQPTNANCANCHQADGQEFDLSVTGAHTIPEKSKQMRGVNFQIVSFTNTKPGQSPTVVFNIKDNAGQPIQPSEMASLALVLGGPTSDYSNAVSESVTGKNSTSTDDGNFSYTFQARIPDDATGTYAVGIQGYLTKEFKNSLGVPIKDAEGNTQIRNAGYNKVAYGAVTDPVPMPRKQIVDVNNCNACHETLSAHGGSRLNPEFCVLCHNPNNTDAVKRSQAGGPMPPQSIDFDLLIHKLHTGEQQQSKPFIIYGGSPTNVQPQNLSEATYPTDRRNCAKCHLPQSNLVDFIHDGIQPTTIHQGKSVVSQTGAIQTACMSCHDSTSAKAHADTMTATGGRESCDGCHSEGSAFPVSKVHAQ